MTDYHYLESEHWEETPEDKDYIHEDNIPDFESIKENVKGMMKAIYLTGDVAMLESYLDEVCNDLDLKINEGEPILEKKGKVNLTTWYLGYQRAQLDSMQKVI